MKILITGCNGLLGTDLVEQLNGKHEIYVTDIESIDAKIAKKNKYLFDITDFEKTYNSISKINPDLIIHTAAFSDVDGCEKKPEIAYRINSIGTRNIAVSCQRFDTALCCVSTDYVFDGKNPPSGGYIELDSTNPESVYGKSKYMGEFYVKHLLNRFYIVRVSSLFGKRRKNFITQTVQSVRENKKINVVEDQWSCPTYTKDLAEAISILIEKPLYGVYHLTNNNGASRYEVVKEIFKVLNQSTEVKLVKREEVFFAKRPRDSRLRNFLWQLDGFKPLRPWQEALKEFINQEIKT